MNQFVRNRRVQNFGYRRVLSVPLHATLFAADSPIALPFTVQALAAPVTAIAEHRAVVHFKMQIAAQLPLNHEFEGLELMAIYRNLHSPLTSPSKV